MNNLNDVLKFGDGSVELYRDIYSLAIKLCLPIKYYDQELINYRVDNELFETYMNYLKCYKKWDSNSINLNLNDCVNDCIQNVLRIKYSKKEINNEIIYKAVYISNIQYDKIKGDKFKYKYRKTLIENVYKNINLHFDNLLKKNVISYDNFKKDHYSLMIITSIIYQCYCFIPYRSISKSIVNNNYFNNLNNQQKTIFFQFYEDIDNSNFYKLKNSLKKVIKDKDFPLLQEALFYAKHKNKIL